MIGECTLNNQGIPNHQLIWFTSLYMGQSLLNPNILLFVIIEVAKRLLFVIATVEAAVAKCLWFVGVMDSMKYSEEEVEVAMGSKM